jgi:hypothetical protein
VGGDYHQLTCITKLKNKTMCVAGLEKRNKGRDPEMNELYIVKEE